MVAADTLESGDRVWQYEINRDGSQIQIPDFHLADGPRKDDPEVRARAIALAIAYWAVAEPIER